MITRIDERPDDGQSPSCSKNFDEILFPSEIVDVDVMVGLERRLAPEDEVRVVKDEDGGQQDDREVDAPTILGLKSLILQRKIVV